MKKDKTKTQPKKDEKPSVSSEQVQTDKKAKLALRIFRVIFRHKRYWLPPLVVVVVGFLGWQLSQSWAFKATVSQTTTYPQALVLGSDVGNLSVEQLNSKLAELKQEFEARKITLTNADEQKTFDAGKLGVVFDAEATSRAVLSLNNLSLIDKYRLITGGISSVVTPTVGVDNDKCNKSLSEISFTQTQSADALVYFDQGLKIKPDQPGTKFNAVATCQELAKQLAANLLIVNVQSDISPASITKADLEAKLPQIQSMIGRPLSLKSNGTYRLDLTTEQLLALLEISKNDSGVQVGWSSAKLDELVSSIAAKVDSYDDSPALGACQYLSSRGGSLLNRTATKEIFTTIGADSPRSYDLSISHRESVVGTRTPVAAGSKGSIYLTYDDGLTYANQIMNYASCYGIKVTFFELGVRVGVDADALRRAIAEGHAVQSHGYEHALFDYGERSYDWQYNDISQSISSIMSVTGVRPTYFRPPGGNKSADTYTAASANGVKLIMWGDASRDATPGGLSSSRTCANVLAGAYPGASVLMHSTKSSTAEALPCIVDGLAARGYNMQALR